MAIRCGNGHYHDTVAEVRACFGLVNTQGIRERKDAVEAIKQEPYRANKYVGTCVKCGGRVGPMEGRIDRNQTGKWDTSHLEGQCWPKLPAPALKEPVASSTERYN